MMTKKKNKEVFEEICVSSRRRLGVKKEVYTVPEGTLYQIRPTHIVVILSGMYVNAIRRHAL